MELLCFSNSSGLGASDLPVRTQQGKRSLPLQRSLKGEKKKGDDDIKIVFTREWHDEEEWNWNFISLHRQKLIQNGLKMLRPETKKTIRWKHREKPHKVCYDTAISVGIYYIPTNK